jgi:hypothetical protein
VKLYSSVLRTPRNAADAAGSARPQGQNAEIFMTDLDAPSLFTSRDCRAGKDAAREGVVELRRAGCDEAGMVRSARPKGQNAEISANNGNVNDGQLNNNLLGTHDAWSNISVLMNRLGGGFR